MSILQKSILHLCLFFHFSFHLTLLFGSSAGVCFQFEKPWSSAHDKLFGILQLFTLNLMGKNNTCCRRVGKVSWTRCGVTLPSFILASTETGLKSGVDTRTGRTLFPPVGIKSHLSTLIQTNTTKQKVLK